MDKQAYFKIMSYGLDKKAGIILSLFYRLPMWAVKKATNYQGIKNSGKALFNALKQNSAKKTMQKDLLLRGVIDKVLFDKNMTQLGIDRTKALVGNGAALAGSTVKGSIIPGYVGYKVYNKYNTPKYDTLKTQPLKPLPIKINYLTPKALISNNILSKDMWSKLLLYIQGLKSRMYN